MKKIFYILCFITLLTLTSCKGGKHAPQSDSSQMAADFTGSANSQKNSGTSSSGPTYSSDIKPIFEKNCIPCHEKGSAIGNWLDYKTAFAKRALIRTRIFEKKDMPLGKTLADKDRALIAKWVDAGALDTKEEIAEPPSSTPAVPAVAETPNAETPAPVTQAPVVENPVATPVTPEAPTTSSDIDPEKLTYVDNIKPFFEKYCITCHNENSGPVMPNWLQYDIAVLKKEALLDRVVNKKNMPMEGMPAPSSEEREMLNLWIQKGMKYEIK